MRWGHALACPMLLASSIAQSAPLIRDISPHGAQRGKTFTLTLRGEDLTPGAKIQTTLPASISRMIAQETMRPNSELPFLVELKADAPVGLYPIRIVTADGLSNVMLFSVGILPEFEEIESKETKQLNDEFEHAEALRIPGVTNGTLTRHGDDITQIKTEIKQANSEDLAAKAKIRDEFLASQVKTAEGIAKLDTRLAVAETTQKTQLETLNKIADNLQRIMTMPAAGR